MGIEIDRILSLMRGRKPVQKALSLSPEESSKALPWAVSLVEKPQNQWDEWPEEEEPLAPYQVYDNLFAGQQILINALHACPQFIDNSGEPNYIIDSEPSKTVFNKNEVEYTISYSRSPSAYWIAIKRDFISLGDWDQLDVNGDGYLKYVRYDSKVGGCRESMNTMWTIKQVERFARDIRK